MMIQKGVEMRNVLDSHFPTLYYSKQSETYTMIHFSITTMVNILLFSHNVLSQIKYSNNIDVVVMRPL